MNLTRIQLKNALDNNRYVLLRFSCDNSLIGVNSKSAKIKHAARFCIDNTETQFISYIPCSFMEYISYKVPFI